MQIQKKKKKIKKKIMRSQKQHHNKSIENEFSFLTQRW